VRPDCLPEVTAADGPRFLTRHVGPSLHEVYAAGGVPPAWEEILPLYAELQIEAVPLVDEALAAGTPDFRPHRLAERATHFLEPPELDAVARAVDGLGDLLPPMIAHEEVHEGNVFVANGRPFFLDWAEACVSHPFVGSVLMLRAATERAGLEPGSADVERLRDLYLEPFTVFAPLQELREVFDHAYLLGAICRVLTWNLILAGRPASVVAELRNPPGAWLELFRGLRAGSVALGGA
jgi:hypothetical protein